MKNQLDGAGKYQNNIKVYLKSLSIYEVPLEDKLCWRTENSFYTIKICYNLPFIIMRKTKKDSVTQPLEGALWLLNWPDVCPGSLINL